ncbi:Translin [Meredithblackwellia eburnea MCA 4105]
MTDSSPSTSRAQVLLDTFATFRTEIDAHYDQRERIIKLSRDITALSKKLIFALHRITSRDKKLVFKEAEDKLNELRLLFSKVAVEVQGQDFWRYEKSISPGIQEFIEGYTFYYFLQHDDIPTLQQVQDAINIPPTIRAPKPVAPASTDESSHRSTAPETSPTTLPAPQALPILVTVEDYLGGIADLTGEIMRLAIGSVGSSLGSKDGVASIHRYGTLVREIKGEMDPLAPYARWLHKKLTVLDQSLAKIEAASYALQIRGAEFAHAPEMLAMLVKNIGNEAPAPPGAVEV